MSNKPNLHAVPSSDERAELAESSKKYADNILALEKEIAEHQHAYASTFSNIALQAALKMITGPLASKEDYDAHVDSAIEYAESIRAKLDNYKTTIAAEAEVHPDVYRHIDHLKNQKAFIDQRLSSLTTPAQETLEETPVSPEPEAA